MADRTGLRSEPSRTCVGCRGTDSWLALLRVVVATDPDTSSPSGPVVLSPDPRHRMPGRGAWLHPRAECFELAVRRKAFGRALRVLGTTDATAIARYLGISVSRHPAPEVVQPGPPHRGRPASTT